MGSWKGRRNQYFVKDLYCKLPVNNKKITLFFLEYYHSPTMVSSNIVISHIPEQIELFQRLNLMKEAQSTYFTKFNYYIKAVNASYVLQGTFNI